MSFESEYALLQTNVDDLLRFASIYGCSDLFIKVGEPAYFYRYGMMYRTNNVLTPIDWNNFIERAITNEQKTRYVREKMMDFSYTIDGGKYRYRASAGYSAEKNICTFRMISQKLPTFDSLKLDPQVVKLLHKAFSMKSGITMLVGATGSGKTNTIASCINSFSTTSRGNENMPLKDANIITLEDPIEFVYPSKSATRIVQKELGVDFKSYDNGIKQALREHPTSILVGETRDKETIKALIECSVTGHAVWSTFHASTVMETIRRLYMHLYDGSQDIMFDLINCMNFILAQQLVKGRKGYRLRYQYMFFTNEIREIIIKSIYGGKNIEDTINKLMHNESIVKAGLANDWNF